MAEPTVTKFCVIYDGEDHKNHEMNAITLGGALTALGKALYEANDIINGERNSIDVKVDAKFIKGSFGINVELLQFSPYAKDILSLLGFMGASATAVTAASVLNWLKGEKITLISNKDGGIDTIQAGNKSIDCPSEISRLVTNSEIRKALDEMIRVPLINKGTSSVAFKADTADKEATLIVNKETAKSFVKLAVEEIKESEEQEKTIKFIAANIRKKSGWKIDLDGEEVYAKMDDEFFKERLENMKEAHIFGKKFNVLLETVRKKSYGTSSKSYVIKRVHHESRS